MSEGNIRVVMADDQVLFLESLKVVIEERAKDLEVVGIANNGRDAVNLIRTEKPDVALLDVRMPEMDGVEAVRMLGKDGCETLLVMLTTFDDDKYVFEALDSGAVGYLLKDIPADDLINAVHSIMRGQTMLSQVVASKLIKRARSPADGGVPEAYHSQGSESEPAPSISGPDSLRPREREIFDCLVSGYSNQEIAYELSIAEQTVKNHVSEVYSKLGVHDRLHLLRIARAYGWIK